MLFKAHLYYGSINNHFPTLAFNGVYVLDKKCNNVFIRNALSSTPGCPSKAQSKWRICYPDSDLNNLWTFPHRFFIPSKIKELHFKIVHRYYPCNLFRFFENISSLCSFCNTDEESILHLFCHCPFSKSFWSKVTFLISFCCKQIIDITESIIFLSDFHSKDSNLEHTVLLLCLLGKFHLHKARIIHCKPNFRMFSFDIKISFTSFKNVSKPLNSKASKTFNILESVVRYL